MQRLEDRPHTPEWDRFISGIWSILREEYGLEEVDSMLSTASYEETSETVTIIYLNSNSDVFQKVTSLQLAQY